MPTTQWSAARTDIKDSLRRFHLPLWLGSREALLPYRGSLLGPWWMTIQTALWAGAIGFLMAPSIGANDPDYYLYVTIGISIFSVFQVFISEGSNTFVKERNLILNVPNPFFIYVLKISVKAAIGLIMALPVVLAAMFVVGQSLAPVALLAVPGLVLCFLFGIGITLTLGTLALRFRDLIFATRAAMRLLFFVTPVFWIVVPGSSLRSLVADINPLYHLITLVREPILGHNPDSVHWLIGGGVTLGILGLGLALFGWFRGRMAVWL